WTLNFPSNDHTPGTDLAPPDPWSLFEAAIEWLFDFVKSHDQFQATPVSAAPSWIERLADKAAGVVRYESLELQHLLGGLVPHDDSPASHAEHGDVESTGHHLTWLRNMVRAMHDDPHQHNASDHSALVWLIKSMMDGLWWLLKDDVATDQAA